MSRTAFRALAHFSISVLSAGLLVASAKADITWTVQPSTRIGASATVYFSAFDLNNPSDPDPNSDGYVPPITITTIPQTDAGTSGDPALGSQAVNSLFGGGAGFFTTKGNTPTSSLNFGNPLSSPVSALTVAGTNVGNFYPSIIPPPNAGAAQDPTFDFNGQPVYHFGQLGPVNSAGTLWTQSPLTGYNALTGGVFSQSSRDDGRIAMYGLKALPVSNVAIPVTGGQFDANLLAFNGTIGVAFSLAPAMDPNGIEGIIPQSLVLPPEAIGVNRVTNLLFGAAAVGTITRAGVGVNTGPDYIMSAPFKTSFVLSQNMDGTDQLSVFLAITIVAKANILPGDVNFDGLVNATDRSIVLSHLGQTSTDHLGVGDANGDGVVNTSDLQLVPEPATLVGLAIGLVSLGDWRLRRGAMVARW